MKAMSHPPTLTDPLLVLPFFGLCSVYFLSQQSTTFPQFSETSVLLKMAPILYLLAYVGFIRPTVESSRWRKKNSGKRLADNNDDNGDNALLKGDSSSSSSSSSLLLKNSYKKYFTFGLVFSCVGDFFVASRSTFVYGVVAFSAAHFMYILGLRVNGSAGKARYSWYGYPGVISTLVMIVTSKIESYPLMFLICVYNLIVFSTLVHAMCCYECSSGGDNGGRGRGDSRSGGSGSRGSGDSGNGGSSSGGSSSGGSGSSEGDNDNDDFPSSSLFSDNRKSILCGLIGAASFAVSDLLIAVDLWVLPVPYPQAFIMVTYYLAQFFMATSVF